MKTKLLFLLLLTAIVAQSQTRQPFSNIGKKVKVVTLSNGKYDEFFDENPLQRIGSLVININTRKITKIELSQAEIDELENGQASRFLSVDPLTKQYPFYTPYQYASNTPICSIDLDGLEGLIATGMPLGNSGVSHGMVISVGDAAKIDKAVVVTTFRAVFSEALPKKLIDHYAYGNGKPYVLNKNEAVAIQSAPTGLKGLVDNDKVKFDNLLSEGMKKGCQIKLPEGYSIQGGATTGGTLGRFPINLKGTITIDKNDVNKWSFDGTMQFSDVWDFKTNPVSDKDLKRSEWGDIQTTLALKFLPGKAFNVTSEVIPIKQKSTDDSFDWYNGKTANGKQNEVSNDLKSQPTESKKVIKTGKSEL